MGQGAGYEDSWVRYQNSRFGEFLVCNVLALFGEPHYRYEELAEEFYEDLEGKVEEAAKDAISKARRTVLTNTSKKVSRVLKRLLLSVPAEADELAASEAAGARGAPDRAHIFRRIEAKHEQVCRLELSAVRKFLRGFVFCRGRGGEYGRRLILK